MTGPRSSGKTSQLLRDVAEMGRDAKLSLGFSLVVFAEQSCKVGTTEESQPEGLSRLTHHAPHREDAPDLHHTFEDMRTIRNDRNPEEPCMSTAMLDFPDREGKKLDGAT